MKKISKLLALLLALSLVFCLAACSNKTDAEQIVGSWVSPLNLGPFMDEMMIAEMGETFTSSENILYMNATFTFTTDKFTMAFAIDEDSVEQYLNGLVTDLLNYMYAIAEDKGMTKEELDQEILDANNMTPEEYVKDVMSEALNESIAEMSYEAEALYYKVDSEQGRIYFSESKEALDASEEYMVYSISGNTLTFTKLVSENEEIEDILGLGVSSLTLPWVFEKQ